MDLLFKNEGDNVNNISSQPKVSVIIPIYKAESYIEKCARSLFNQTLDEIEFIFIDDNSPDKSIEILNNIINEFPKRQDRIKIISHQENLGVAQSRQDGLDTAKGEFVIHCDPDDWVELDAYERLYDFAKTNNSDLVICDLFINSEEKERTARQVPEKLDGISILKQISGVSKNIIWGGVTNKFIKRELAISSNFIPHIMFCEDVLYLINILQNSKSIGYLSSPLYHYRQVPGSLVHSFNEQIFLSDLQYIKAVSEIIGNTQERELIKIGKALIGGIICLKLFRYSCEKYKLKKSFKQYASLVFKNNHTNVCSKICVYSALKINFTLFQIIFYKLKALKQSINKILCL